MRRAIPQKGQSVPSRICEQNAMENQPKQALPEGNRRVRTSAAMIGLAVSVGACGLSLPHQGEQVANAAEPTSADPATSSVSNSFEAAAVPPSSNVGQANTSTETASLPIKHTVQEGQTLWDVARFYGTDVSALAAMNGLRLNSVIRVGQVLTVPVDVRVAQAFSSADVSNAPGYYGPISGSTSDTSSSAAILPSLSQDVEFKANQSKSLDTLRQKRESLRLGVNGLPKVSQGTSIATSEPASATSTRKVASSVPSVSAIVSPQEAKRDVETREEQEVALGTTQQFSASDVQISNSVTHYVRAGDTLGTIARANGVTVKQLLQANRISNPNYIFVGQTIVVPSHQSAATPQGKFTGVIAAVPTATVSDVPSTGLTPRTTTLPSSNSSDNSKIAAVASFTTTPQAVDAESSMSRVSQYNHVENLKLEIERLRERYQTPTARVSAVQSEAKVAAVIPSSSATSLKPSAEPVNPEFNPDRYSTRLREIRDRVRPATQPSTPTAQAQSSQLVAVAPLGSESYDPIKSRLGRTVSPELPSLGTGSEFLPSVPGQLNGFIWPAKGVLTSGYGWRWGRMHKGIDIAGPIGTPIVAAAEGRVTYAGWNSGGYGYLVEIQHTDGSLTLYAHNNRILVQVGQEVAQGQQISEMGSTGYSTGPHLHFEVHPSGRGAVNPIALLPKG